MGVLNSNEIGTICQRVNEYYKCELKYITSKTALSIVRRICNEEYALENMPSIVELYNRIIKTMDRQGYNVELVHSNITLIDIRFLGEKVGTMYIVERT